MKTTVIAEAGVNHNGSIDMALELVEIAKAAKVDVVKFQTFKASKLATTEAPRAAYQKANIGSDGNQQSMLSALELSNEAHFKIAKLCEEIQIEFLSTAFDIDSLRFLVDDIGIKRIKVPSGEITNGPYLLWAARTGLPIILSTGMATIGEIEDALRVVAFGYVQPRGAPKSSDLLEAYNSQDGQSAISKKVTILQCGTNYPLPPEDVNLLAMQSFEKSFHVKVGLSDHSAGIAIPIAATALGASLIEKHFTKSRLLPGPDHKASIEPEELSELVKSIRQVELALGNGVKTLAKEEISNRNIVRKSLVAARDLPKGHILMDDDLVAKRPATGISPMYYWDMMGKPLTRSYNRDEKIEV